MANQYYLDSAIWRDLHEGREDKFRPLGEWAFELLRKARASNEKIIYSDLTIDELLIAYDRKTIYNLFKSAGEFLEKVTIQENQVEEAVKLSKKHKIPLGDALHGILARDNNAVMITRDHHFESLAGIVQVKKPEDLL